MDSQPLSNLIRLKGPEMLATAPATDLVALYDRMAPRYDIHHKRWLRHAGAEAQVAVEAMVRTRLTATSHLLDAGCGTGKFARTLLKEGANPDRMALLDPSPSMLTRCADLPVPRIQGRLQDIPLATGEFDIVTCLWALETVPDPAEALSELLRVLRPGGILCLAFCAARPTTSLKDRLMRRALEFRGTGRFLDPVWVMAMLEDMHAQARAIPTNGPASALFATKQ